MRLEPLPPDPLLEDVVDGEGGGAVGGEGTPAVEPGLDLQATPQPRTHPVSEELWKEGKSQGLL